MRARALLEETSDLVVVLDDEARVVALSRRAREAFPALRAGGPIPDRLLGGDDLQTREPVTLDNDGRRETLVFLRSPTEHADYDTLRTGFTAAVSHELRTPLARVLALLESLLLPSADTHDLVEQARAEIDQMRDLIDELLFLGELETGAEVGGPDAVPALPILESVTTELQPKAVQSGVTLRAEGDVTARVPLRPRMLRVLARNLAENSIRHAGPGSTLTLSVVRADGAVVLEGADDGIGVDARHLPRLFERFYRADRARAAPGSSGLGLAIVKHVVTAAGGTVEARGARGEGLTIRCIFPTP